MNTYLKKCLWCDEMVDPAKCFADTIPVMHSNKQWVCALCGKVLISLDSYEEEEPHSPSQPLDQPE